MDNMKRAGEVISAFFDEKLMKKAQGYSKLFASWAEITGKNGIAAAAAHSRIRELEKGMLLIEADHPGWKQILQTKQSKLLNDYRHCFPGLDISGISLVLSRKGPGGDTEEAARRGAEGDAAEGPPETVSPPEAAAPSGQTGQSGYNGITDEAFRECLKRLEQSIAAKEGARKKT